MNQVKFSSKLNAVLVAAGCSVGLGNIWRFPYVAGESGGGAFLLLYLLCIILIGMPVLMSELIVGRQTHLSAVGAYRTLSKKWTWLGYNGVITAFLIMGFYYVVAGWTAEYFIYSVTGELTSMTSQEQYGALFENFISQIWKPIIYTWIFIAATHFIIYAGVEKGLEKVSKILMPLLFIILIAMCINSLLLPNSSEGLKFFLYPDFSKLDGEVFLQAVGQAFFSLSIGLGAMVAYGSYIPKDADIRKTAFQVMTLDTMVAVMAGLIIFPAAASVNVSPDAGPKLVFETLPAIFNALPFSQVWATVFFLLLIIAAITSTMSLHEVTTVFFMEEFKLSRKVGATLTSLSMMALTAAVSLSVTFKGLDSSNSLFAILDMLTANYLLPLGGVMTSIFVGWFLDRKILKAQMTNDDTIPFRLFSVMVFMLKYLCPISIFFIFLDNLGLV